MKILIIGGTKFLGRHLVETIVSKGYDLTLFNRGETNPDLFPEIETIRGDRDGDLGLIGDRPFDLVIDTCGYFPRIVGQAIDYFKNRVKNYIFISTTGVYRDLSVRNSNENAPLDVTDEPDIEEITEKSYGPLKVICEKMIMDSFPERTLIIRPGLIVGPYDPSDRFSYWVDRLNRGGKVIIPDDPDFQAQFIDVRDLVEWIVSLIEKGRTGIYNAVGPKEKTTLVSMLENINSILGNKSELVRIAPEFLTDNKVEAWSDLPVWIDRQDKIGMVAVDNSKAIENGLTFRPLKETVNDTLEWLKTRPDDHKWLNGLDTDREREVFEKWFNSKS